jgi:hypothetical protein
VTTTLAYCATLSITTVKSFTAQGRVVRHTKALVDVIASFFSVELFLPLNTEWPTQTFLSPGWGKEIFGAREKGRNYVRQTPGN